MQKFTDMKQQKLIFNYLLLKYKKYKAKLNRFRLTGKNTHRQGVLQNHLEKLEGKLYTLLSSFKKASAIAAVATSLTVCLPNEGNSQVIFAGQETLTANLFGLVDIGFNSNANLIDLDGDGDLDLMSGEFYGSFFYFQNTAGAGNTPTFAAVVGNPFGLTSVGLASNSNLIDLDGDGDLDLMSGEYDGNFFYFENTGTASAPAFAAVVTNPFGLSDIGSYSNSNLIDLDGDGDLDLMSGGNSGSFFYFRNIGTASAPDFEAPVTNLFGLSDIGYVSNSNLIDVDGDGDLDLMSGANDGNFFYFRNTGTASTPAFAAPVTNPFGLEDIGGGSNSDLIDVDGDGDLDFISGSGSGNFFYANNNAGAGNEPNFTVAFPLISNPFGLTDIGNRSNTSLVDLDNDGDLDLMSGEYSGRFFYFENIGTASAPAFADSIINPFGLTDIGFRSNLDLIDLDGDGDLDLMSGEYYGNFYYFQNTGTASAPAFAAAVVNPFGLSDIGDRSNSNLVDLDNDGDLDLISGTSNTFSLFYFENTGTATAPAFASSVENPFGLTNIGTINKTEFVDIDNDGDLDAMTGERDGDFYYFRNTGSATAPQFSVRLLNPFGLINSGSGYNTPTIVDIDGDGNLDLLSGGTDGNFYFYKNVTCEIRPLSLNLITNTPESSANSNDGAVTITATGGNGPVNIVWDNGQTGAAASSLTTGNYIVTLTDENDCEFSQTIFVDNTENPNSINSVALNSLNVYPNPSNGFVTVNLKTTEATNIDFRIVNTVGATLLQETAESVIGNFTQTFNLSNLGNGIYFLQINDGKGATTKKIIISK
jgi:hypothetical protein